MTPSDGERDPLRTRTGAGQALVDAGAGRSVARPASAEDVVSILRAAHAEGRPVLVGDAGDGGGEPAVAAEGEAAATQGSGRSSSRSIRVELSRMANLLTLDETSLLVHAQAGIRLAELQAHLEARGLTLGPLPAATMNRTLGAVLSSPRPSEATPRGTLLEACAAVDAVLPDGRVIATRLAPRKATGPDFAHALLAARGGAGVITAAWMRATRIAAHAAYAGYAFARAADALAVAERLLSVGVRPADLKLADAALAPPELRVALADAEVFLAAHLDGAPELVNAEEGVLAELCLTRGAAALPARLVEGWFTAKGFPSPKSIASPLSALSFERYIPLPQLAVAWSARPRPALLYAFRPAGATLRTSSAVEVDRAPPAVAESRAALFRALAPAPVAVAQAVTHAAAPVAAPPPEVPRTEP